MKSTEIRSIRPEGVCCSYSGYLSVPTLTEQAAEHVRTEAVAAGLDIDIGSSSIEFAYDGRDSNGFVVEFLQQVASAVGTASGEIRCEVSSEDGDPSFEFYRISGGRLLRQFGTIVRRLEHDVSPDSM